MFSHKMLIVNEGCEDFTSAHRHPFEVVNPLSLSSIKFYDQVSDKDSHNTFNLDKPPITQSNAAVSSPAVDAFDVVSKIHLHAQL